MGKCTNRKTAKAIPLTELSQSFLGGIRTRAKTIAAVDYLELRSRRLEKPPLLRNSQKQFGFNSVQKNKGVKVKSGDGIGIGCVEIEATFGENDFELGRNTRESTPNSLIKPADTITAPSSTTKVRSSVSARQRNIIANTPPAQEIEEFFAQLEQTQQHRFIEKYNFDVVNDMPLLGRYEWVEVALP